MFRTFAIAALIAVSLPVGQVWAQSINLYTSRHYQSDEAMYEAFTAQTGISVNRIEGKGDELIARLQAEGANSPADIFVTADAGILWRAEEAGLFQPSESNRLNELIPERFRHPDGLWYGFSQRARLIFYNPDLVDGSGLTRYEDLADPRYAGEVCIRSSSNVYNLSLLGSIIAADGVEAAEAWAAGVVANMARDPQGGDTDQLLAAATGECGIAVANSYYFARLAASSAPEDQAVVAALSVVFPNQEDRGTHVNISGAGILVNAPHAESAMLFLEFLASEAAQRIFADGNNEYPIVEGIAASPVLTAFGSFKADPLPVAVYGENQSQASMIFDRVGWH